MPVNHTKIDNSQKRTPDLDSAPSGMQALIDGNRRANQILDSRDTQSRNDGVDPQDITYKRK